MSLRVVLGLPLAPDKRLAERIKLKEFDQEVDSGVRAGHKLFFESCLPVEILAKRGSDALAFGPLRPVGLVDPRTNKRPYAVVQLRQDNVAATLYNLVGFQTNLSFSAQKRVFRMIPGLENAEFVRYGQMHRNTFLNSPILLRPTMQFKQRKDLLFVGQITGIEGYAGCIATGLLGGINAAMLLQGKQAITLPDTTMIGALCRYITNADAENFQPMKANFGVLPPLEGQRKLKKHLRKAAYSQRSLTNLEKYIEKRQIAHSHS